MSDRRVFIWLPGLAVACGAAVATAHGLYEVALAARVPAGIAWLYPLITDGLALVAYAATARLRCSAARYAWAVVVAAAGLSGLAQAAWLAADGLVAAPVLRFGIGAWPAVAAAVVAHLLYLLIDTAPRTDNAEDAPVVSSEPVSNQPSNALSEAALDAPSTPTPRRTPRHRTPTPPGAVRARAAEAAHAYHAEHGALPTVRALMALAGVSRGTAASALAALRQQPTPLHLVTPTKNPSPKERSQP